MGPTFPTYYLPPTGLRFFERRGQAAHNTSVGFQVEADRSGVSAQLSDGLVANLRRALAECVAQTCFVGLRLLAAFRLLC